MVLSASFLEIQDFINKKVSKDIKLSGVDNRTITATTNIAIPILGEKEVTVFLTLLELKNDYALIAYSGGFGVDVVVPLALKYLIGKSKVTYLEVLPDNRLEISLDKIPQLNGMLNMILLRDLSFTTTRAELKFDVITN